MAKATILRCPVQGCDSDGFDGLWGVKVHYARVHKSPKWQESWDQAVLDGTKLPTTAMTTTSRPGGFIFNAMVDALSAHPQHEMGIPEFMTAFRSRGYQGSIESLRSGLAFATDGHPEVLERSARGVYRLRVAPTTRVSKSVGRKAVEEAREEARIRRPATRRTLDKPINGDVSSLQSEVERLRRRSHRQQEVIMVLTRLAMEED